MSMLDWLLGPKEETRVPEPLPTVAVSLKTGATVMGALLNRGRDAVVLRGALHIGVDRNGNEVKERLDGDCVVPVESIDFWQEGLDPALIATLEE